MRKVLSFFLVIIIVFGIVSCTNPDSSGIDDFSIENSLEQNIVSDTEDNSDFDANIEFPVHNNSEDFTETSSEIEANEIESKESSENDVSLSITESPPLPDLINNNNSNSTVSKVSRNSRTSRVSRTSKISRKSQSSRISRVSSKTSSKPSAVTAGAPAAVSNEMVAVWFSYIDWNLCLKGKNRSQFTTAFAKILSGIKKIKANTLIIHVNAFGDAFYPSNISPWSQYVTGTLAKDPGFDPMQIIVDMAAKEKISIHAWLNPMRTLTDAEFKSVPDKFQIKKWHKNTSTRYKYMVKASNGKWTLNPTNSAVRKHISNIAAEVASKYKVDAIHIDDYFYPSGLGTQDNKYYKETNSKMNIQAWRRDGSARMVRQMYSAVKSARSSTLFGISPSGNLNYNLNTMYIDFEMMLSRKGYMDYIVPQIYYGFNNQAQPFVTNANMWDNMVKEPSIKLHIGLAAYKIGLANDQHAGTGKFEWRDNHKNSNNMMRRMIQESKKLLKYSGIVFFDYKSLLTPAGNLQSKTKKEINNFTKLF